MRYRFILVIAVSLYISIPQAQDKGMYDEQTWTDFAILPEAPVNSSLTNDRDSLIQKIEVNEKEEQGNQKSIVNNASHTISIKLEDLNEEVLFPDYVKPLLDSMDAGNNDSNPKWAPSGRLLSFERTTDGKQEILIASTEGEILKKIYYKQVNESGEFTLDVLLPELVEAENSYNANLTWSHNSSEFVFMSNAGEGNYDIYLDGMNSQVTERLTEEKQKDAQPHWSPIANKVTFVSGRTGHAQVYVLDLDNKSISQVTNGSETFFYPRWSPNGKQIAAMYGSNENHDIVILGDFMNKEKLQFVSTWQYDDLSPTWSPDGTKVAFYSNYNEKHDPKVWSIVVVESRKTAQEDLSEYVIATNVIPDVVSGPAWMPDSQHIVYVRNDKHDYSPIYIADIQQKKSAKLETGTKINHDVSCSKDGLVAFRAQVNQWDRIYITKISNLKI